MKVRIEFVPEDSTEERVLKELSNAEEAMDEVSAKIQDTLHRYLLPAFEALSMFGDKSSVFGDLTFTNLQKLMSRMFVSYKFDAWQPKVEVTYVRITEKGET